jgi:hypothetical protein
VNTRARQRNECGCRSPIPVRVPPWHRASSSSSFRWRRRASSPRAPRSRAVRAPIRRATSACRMPSSMPPSTSAPARTLEPGTLAARMLAAGTPMRVARTQDRTAYPSPRPPPTPGASGVRTSPARAAPSASSMARPEPGAATRQTRCRVARRSCGSATRRETATLAQCAVSSSATGERGRGRPPLARPRARTGPPPRCARRARSAGEAAAARAGPCRADRSTSRPAAPPSDAEGSGTSRPHRSGGEGEGTSQGVTDASSLTESTAWMLAPAS